MERCECNQPGFCEFFRQEMTYDPPNWQWCQNATIEERMKYKKSCDKKHDRRNRIVNGKFLTINDLIEDCKKHLIPKLGELDLKGIAGIPRSGVLPASLCALWLNIPLYTFNKKGKFSLSSAISPFGGKRMQDHKETKGKILVLDDTVYGGIAMRQVKKLIDDDSVIYGSLYVHPASLYAVDVFGKELEPPHLLEWNFFNSSYIEDCLLDFDGILSPNVPYEKSQNEEDYIDYITNVKPFYHRIPRTYKCKGIVTARLEKYRDVTEAWLKTHEIKYGFLKMYPTEKSEARDSNHIVEAANFKSKVFTESGASFFVESEPAEAALMRSQVYRLVICPDEGRFS
tara:strand:+ start:193 stop:1218 length:1026 start_codon:yes stop_codon:yes gene_type:complete